MATSSPDFWTDLLKAWGLHMLWIILAGVIPCIVALIIIFDSFSNIENLWRALVVLPIYLIGAAISAIAPWRYLKKRGFKSAGIITIAGVVAGLALPFGSIFGFLGGGMLFEGGARGKAED